MRARHRELRHYSQGNAAVLDLRTAAKACGFTVRDADERSARIDSGLNFASFGEVIEVHVAPIDDGVTIDIASHCRLLTQIEDWGRNAQNVRRLFEHIERQLDCGPGRVVPICGRCGYPQLNDRTAPETCIDCGAALAHGRRFALGRLPRTGLIFLIVMTSIEFAAVIIGLALLGHGSAAWASIAGWLLGVNTIVVAGILLLGGLWRSVRSRA